MGIHHNIVRDQHLAGGRHTLKCNAVETDDPAFNRYLYGKFMLANEERLHVVYCDDRNRYLFDETQVIGGKHSLTLRARPLISRALTLGASGIILAHNHLSGVCRPSDNDVVATRQLQQLGSALELQILDHLIFTRQRVFSMLAGGFL